MLVASTIGAVAKSLGNLCENHGGHVTYFEQGKSLLEQLIDGKHEVLMVELNFIEGEHRDLITRIRAKKQLQDLFVVVYAPSEMSKEEQARRMESMQYSLLPLLTPRSFLFSNGLFPFPSNAYSSVLLPMMNFPQH